MNEYDTCFHGQQARVCLLCEYEQKIRELKAEVAQQEKRWQLGRIVCEHCGQSWLDDGLNPLDCPYCANTRLRRDLENQLMLIARAQAAERRAVAAEAQLEAVRRLPRHRMDVIGGDYYPVVDQARGEWVRVSQITAALKPKEP